MPIPLNFVLLPYRCLLRVSFVILGDLYENSSLVIGYIVEGFGKDCSHVEHCGSQYPRRGNRTQLTEPPESPGRFTSLGHAGKPLDGFVQVVPPPPPPRKRLLLLKSCRSQQNTNLSMIFFSNSDGTRLSGYYGKALAKSACGLYKAKDLLLAPGYPGDGGGTQLTEAPEFPRDG